MVPTLAAGLMLPQAVFAYWCVRACCPSLTRAH